MGSSGYWCYCCNVQIKTEKEGYEHDVSMEHHKRFEEQEKRHKRPVGNMTGLTLWTAHVNGKPHRKAMNSFYEYYATQAKNEVPSEQNFASCTDDNKIFSIQKSSTTSVVKPNLDNAKKKTIQQSKSTRNRPEYEQKPFAKKYNTGASTHKSINEITQKSSKDQQGGMMMDILETITNDPRDTSSHSIGSSQARRSTVYDEKPRRLSSKRSAEPYNLKDKFKYRRTSKVMQVPSNESPKEKVTLSSQPLASSQPLVKSNLTEDLDKAGELERMQVALTISQELDTLKVEQDKLETQLQTLHSRLSEIKVRRKELKQRRANLLKGLAHSDTDEEDAQHATPFIEGHDPKNSLTIQDKTFEKRIVSVAPVHSKSVSLSVSSADTPRVSIAFEKPQVSTTIASSIVSPPRIAHVESTVNSVASPLAGHHYADIQRPKIVNYTSNATTNNGMVPQIYGDTNSINEPPQTPENRHIRPNTMDTSHSSLMSSNSPLPPAPPLPTSQTFVPNESAQNILDLDRLALIRQALQSPDSWQFTFSEVDQMLKRTAAKVAASKAQNPTSVCSTPLINSEIPQTTTLQKPHENPIHIKGEPLAFNSSSNVLPQPPPPPPIQPSFQMTNSSNLPSSSNLNSLSSNPHVLKPSQDSSSSSFSSSDDDDHHDRATSRVSQKHSKKRLDLDMSKSRDPVAEEQSNPRTSANDLGRTTDGEGAHRFVNSFQSKDIIKYGEFHAFGGSPAAVTDMALRTSTRSVFVGGQNGSVVYFDLKTHKTVRSLPSRDASVTKMGLDVNERHLFVGYYDYYFVQYNAENAIKSHEKFFSSRIEAIAVTPLADVPFVFLGLASGDILRHDINNYTTGLLCRHSALHVDPNSQNPCRMELDKVHHGLAKKSEGDYKFSSQSAGISSLAVVQSGTCLLLIIGGQDHSLTIRTASDGTLLWFIQSAPHKGPPEGIASLPSGSLFLSYFERTVRIHNWKTGNGVLTFQTPKITSSCVMKRYIALGDSEGAIRVYKIQESGLPAQRPMKVYFASSRTAITCLISSGDALIAGSMDGTVTTLWVNEPASDYICLYGPFGQNCGIGFTSRKDLVQHVLDTHLIFGNQKSIMCRWGAGRCRVRFTETQTMKSISDHLLTHIPD